jgi:predicted DNA-binding transcriptional regulator AlpA
MTPAAVHLLTAAQVAEILNVPVKRVYTLPIPKRMLGKRTCRWRESDVYAFIEGSTSSATQVAADGPSTADWALPTEEERHWRATRRDAVRPARPTPPSAPRILDDLSGDDIAF